MKKICFLILCVSLILFQPEHLNAQKQLNHWRFGIKLEMEWDCAGNYTVNSTKNPTRIVSGSSTVSDKRTGQLLFHVVPGDFNLSFADGGIYDNTNGYMQLSSGGPAEINFARGGSVAIPVSQNIWYIFYTSENTLTNITHHYSIIDMSLPGNGTVANPSGEVTSHQIPLSFGGGTAVRHINGTDYWLCSRTSNTSIEARQISLSGIGAPVTSTVNWLPPGMNPIASKGGLAFSVDGSKAAWAFGVVDFDIATGVFSNDFILTNHQEFGSAFSHNCKYLYKGGRTRGSQSVYQGYITRYEVSTLSATSIPDTIAMSGVQSTSNWAPGWGSLGRLHYDGNIYFKNGTYGDMSILRNPNSANPTIDRNAITFPGAWNAPGTWGSGGMGSYLASWAVEVLAESISDSLTFTNNCDKATYDFNGESCGLVTSYLWDFGDGSTGTGKNPTHTYTAGGTYNIQMVVVNDSTCSIWNTDTIYKTLIVDLKCTPPVAAFSASDSIICIGECVTFTDSSSSASAWNWTFNGGSVTTDTSQGPHIICFNTPGIYDIDLIVTNIAGADTASRKIEVLEIDDAAFTYSSDTICHNATGVLPIGIITTGGTFSISNGGIIDTTTGEINTASSSLGSYTITHITNGGCPDTAIFTVEIINCTPPTAAYTISNNDSTICEGDCISFTDSSSLATSWNWSFDGANPDIDNAKGPHSVCFNNPGIYTVELVVANRAGEDRTSSTIVVYANPVVSLGEDIDICADQTELVPRNTADSTNNNYASYLWSNGATSPSLIATNSDTYSVEVTNANGCPARDEIKVLLECPHAIWVPNAFTPNGDGNNNTFKVESERLTSLEVTIFNRWGEKIYFWQEINGSWDGTLGNGEIAPIGVYPYLVTYGYVKKQVQKSESMRGHVNLIR